MTTHRRSQSSPAEQKATIVCSDVCKVFEEEHLALYKHMDIQYPPDLGNIQLYDDFAFMTFGLSRRQQELVIWAHESFEHFDPVEFLDSNMSLGKLCGFSLKKGMDDCNIKSPWSTNIRTLVASTALIQRDVFTPDKSCFPFGWPKRVLRTRRVPPGPKGAFRQQVSFGPPKVKQDLKGMRNTSLTHYAQLRGHQASHGVGVHVDARVGAVHVGSQCRRALRAPKHQSLQQHGWECIQRVPGQKKFEISRRQSAAGWFPYPCALRTVHSIFLRLAVMLSEPERHRFSAKGF